MDLWVARDKNGRLYLFHTKEPRKIQSEVCIWINSYYPTRLPDDLFSNISWEDKKATKITSYKEFQMVVKYIDNN